VEAWPDAPARWWYEQSVARQRLEQWDRAALALAEAVSRRADAPPRWWARLGNARWHLEDWGGAAQAYEEAVARRPDQPVWVRRLTHSHERHGDWAAAADAMDRFVAMHTEPSPHLLRRLARLQEKAHDLEAAARTHRRALVVDEEATPADLRLLSASPVRLDQRRRTLGLVEELLDEIRDRSAAAPPAVQDRSDVIWTYWAQGFDQAPPVVQMCRRRLEAVSSRPVESLDATTMGKHATLPTDLDRLELSLTHRADLLRLDLLSRYGGTWMDATCFAVEDPGPALDSLRSNGFFAFDRQGRTIATWLVSSTPGHHVVSMMREALYAQLRNLGSWPYYFLIQHTFEALVELDPQFRAEWDAMPHVSWRRPHQFAARRAVTVSSRELAEMSASCFVQKLTYKNNEQALANEDSLLSQLLRTY
jgi:tetratricopeptide (TPR) repeat protein